MSDDVNLCRSYSVFLIDGMEGNQVILFDTDMTTTCECNYSGIGQAMIL